MVSFAKSSGALLDGVTSATLMRDAVAGAVTALVTVAYCISFSALIFQGPIAGGFALGLSALLTGTVITGLIVALTTTLAPADAGPDTPAVAVMSVLAASVASSLSVAGLGPDAIVTHALVAISISTALTGFVLFGLGALRLGVWLRFVPFPVIGGFLAASGWLLITGGVEVMSGVKPALSLAALRELGAPERLPQFVVGLAFAATVLLVRQRTDSFVVLPVTFFAFLIGLDVALLGLGLGAGGSWFLADIGSLTLWAPLSAISNQEIEWGVLAQHSVEIGAVCGVTAVSMLLDVSSLEVARQKSADLDHELKTNGAANVIAAALGGVVGNLSLNGSILIREAGALTRFSGMFAALVCAGVLLVGGDLATLIPKPLLGGLLVYIGLIILGEALVRSPAQRSATDLTLAGAIMLVIVFFGYLTGVMIGVIGASLLFAFSYSRIGVVRRHLSRANFSSNVERQPAEARILRDNGQQIQIYWLSGFIFFGSSNGLFEYVRRSIDSQTEEPTRFVILDFSTVPGVDTSAVLSIVKLANYCNENGAILVFAGLSERIRALIEAAGLLGHRAKHKAFATRNDALEWCENKLLAVHDIEIASEASFNEWLGEELGDESLVKRLMSYFERIELHKGDVLFAQGDPSDSVEMVAAGCVAVTVTQPDGKVAKLRRMTGQTVIGEMGFYRGQPRAATILAEEPTVVYRLTRKAFLRMHKRDPEIVSSFNRLIVRVLSDRLDFANREIAALL